LRALDAADRTSQNTPGGGLNFVVFGGAPTGVEMAGTLADMMKRTVPNEYRQVPYKDARVFLIEATPSVLGAFSRDSQRYAASALMQSEIPNPNVGQRCIAGRNEVHGSPP
jgi:NADH dehydrogenase